MDPIGFCFRSSLRGTKGFYPGETKPKNNFNFLSQNCSGQVSVCLKPAPPISIGCKFTEGPFSVCRKI